MFRLNSDPKVAQWSKLDPITERTICQNILIVGQSGSGKTSGPGDLLFRSLVGHRRTGGCFLASKTSDRDYVIKTFRKAGRLDDLLIIEPGGRRFNVLNYELQRGADARVLTQVLMCLGETLDRAASGGQDDAFFKIKAREGLEHAIEILIRAEGTVDPWLLQIFITGAAMELKELNDERWKNDFHAKCLNKATANCVTDMQKHDCEVARHHWESTWPRLNDRTRTSVEASMLSPLHVLNTGQVRDLLATNTDVTPEDMEQCKWIMVNQPITPGDATAIVINAAVKLAVQRYILKRKGLPSEPLLTVWSDEFQLVANSRDRPYVETCRSHRGSLVALTQSTHAVYANIYGHGTHEADALLSNFGHVCVCTLGDSKTAEYFADRVGQRMRVYFNPQITPGRDQDEYDILSRGVSGVAMSASQHMLHIVPTTTFLSGLRTGGPPDNTVDCIVLRSGQPFAQSGENYLFMSCKQH
jgi:TraM recognition site of TraD and TraG